MIFFVSPHSPGPYEIMVRELVAVDGSDSSEILLIDAQGCPTDASIMGVVSRVDGNGQLLEAPFDAFKFPSSDVVQFRALVTPCVPACEPVKCNLINPDTGLQKESLSYGRRRRSARMAPLKNSTNDDVVVVGAIKITDSMIEYKDGKKSKQNRAEPTPIGIFEERIITETLPSGNCTDFVGLVVTFVVFLIAQLTLIVAWYYVYRIKMQRKLLMSSKTLATMAHHHHASTGASSSSGSMYNGHSGYPSFVSSSECLNKSSPNSTIAHHSIHPHHQHPSINYNAAMYKM